MIVAVGSVATALVALAAPAGAASKPHAAQRSQAGFSVPTRLLPGGIAPGTPREDWDRCDQPYSLYLDSAFISPSKYAPFVNEWETFGLTSVKAALSNGTYYAPGAAQNPRQPWPAYVACTVSGPVTVPDGHVPVRFGVTITDVSPQTVQVAWATNPKLLQGPGPSYSTWAHAHWVPLRPGQSTTFTTPTFTLGTKHWWYRLNGYWLVRPSVPPVDTSRLADDAQGRWENFTEWIYAFNSIGPYLDADRPTGQCSATLVPGTVDGIASAPNGGYWALSSDGEISTCDARGYGDASTADAIATVRGTSSASIAAPPHLDGLWVAMNGAVMPFGRAAFRGQDDAFLGISVQPAGKWTAASVNSPAIPTFVSVTSTPSGQGYWLLTAYGHVLAYNAPYYGSADFAGATVCRAINDQPCTPTMQGRAVLTPLAAAGMAPTDGGKGYVIVERDGSVARFGKAPSCALPTGTSVVGVAADYRTGGYWAATTNGHVYACQAPNWPYKAIAGTVAGIAGLDNGLGYRLVTTNGQVYDYGAATWHGDPN